MKICGMKSQTFFNVINVVLGGTMSIFGILSFLSLFGKMFDDRPVIAITFHFYQVIFGLLLAMTACKYDFITINFFFLRSTAGKGCFNLFLSSMFLVGSEESLYGYLMAFLFGVIGLFFVIIGCCTEAVDTEEDKEQRAKATAMTNLAMGEAKAKYGHKFEKDGGNGGTGDKQTGDNAGHRDD